MYEFFPSLKQKRRLELWKEVSKCRNIAIGYYFVPINFETFGLWGLEGQKFVNSIEKKRYWCYMSKEINLIFFQRISTVIQRGNWSCALGTVSHSEDLDKVFEFVSNPNWKWISVFPICNSFLMCKIGMIARNSFKHEP